MVKGLPCCLIPHSWQCWHTEGHIILIDVLRKLFKLGIMGVGWLQVQSEVKTYEAEYYDHGRDL